MQQKKTEPSLNTNFSDTFCNVFATATWFLFLFLLSGCEQTIRSKAAAKIAAVNPNQTQFTFLVFDNSSVETFFKKYQPLASTNISLTKALQDSLMHQNFQENLIAEKNIAELSRNTSVIDSGNFNLALRILKAGAEGKNEKYFSACANYQFFYECLPKQFQCKWSQSTQGHFEFNGIFFALLREKSKELDDLIYGNNGLWQSDMKTFFGDYIFNEISPSTAQKIKNTIMTDEAFNDNRFSFDRALFLTFLDHTISNKWRMIMIDWG
jgi:hypothetical protein